jgi:subtilisin-like proprotein convertase family protein
LLIDVGSVDQGRLTLDAAGYNVGDSIGVNVADGNASTPVTVTATTPAGESETFTLTSSGGINYSTSIPVVGGNPTANDGILTAAPGTVVTFSYVDADDGSGNSAVRTATANIRNVVKYFPSDVPVSITDNATFTSQIVITDAGTVADIDLGVEITHTFDGDLDVFLIAPDGTRVELFTDVGGSGDNFVGTVLDDEAATSIAAGTAPFTGMFSPEGLLSALDGMSITGTWTLEITDDAGGDIGSLNDWSLCIDVIPVDPPVNLSVADAGTVSEGNTGSMMAEFVVTLDVASSDTVFVDYATTVAGYAFPATAGVDFTAVSGTLQFDPGETSKTIQVPVLGDLYMENIEQFGIQLSNPVSATLADDLADATIGDDEVWLPRKYFDFGPHTAVSTGNLGVSNLIYNSDHNIGWSAGTSGLTFSDDGTSDPLRRDYVSITSDATFTVDVPNVSYTIRLGFGSASIAQDNVRIWIDGRNVGTISTAAGQYLDRVFVVRLSEPGPLNIRFEDLGGASNVAIVNYLQVTNRQRFNFGDGNKSSRESIRSVVDVKEQVEFDVVPVASRPTMVQGAKLTNPSARFEVYPTVAESKRIAPASLLVDLFDEVDLG